VLRPPPEDPLLAFHQQGKAEEQQHAEDDGDDHVEGADGAGSGRAEHRVALSPDGRPPPEGKAGHLEEEHGGGDHDHQHGNP
jgi:hypothetical protein